jgi:hypothetical protein
VLGADYADDVTTAMDKGTDILHLMEEAHQWIATKAKGKKPPSILKRLEKQTKLIYFLKRNYGKDIPLHWTPEWDEKITNYIWKKDL